MQGITTRQFSLYADCGKIYDFMVDIYDRAWSNGVAAPVFEYAYASFPGWMDISYSYKNRIWEENGEIVAFCFYECPTSDIYFSLKPGYEALASEMIAYASEHMVHNGELQLVLFENQRALADAAKKQGFICVYEDVNLQFDFEKELDYPLPEGFYFVKPEDVSYDKISECCWRGFDNEQKDGPWNPQEVQTQYQIRVVPHATTELSVSIANEKGEYVCYAGMWWTPKNRLAYLEPLCTVPEYRKKGLAAAAISELCRRTKMLGATHMTGGSNPFYEKIGYKPAVKWTFWKRQ